MSCTCLIGYVKSLKKQNITSCRKENCRRDESTTCTRAAGFPGFRRQRNVRAAQGSLTYRAEVFFYYVCVLSSYPTSTTTSARAVFPDRYRSGRFLRRAAGWVAYAARPDRPDSPTRPEHSHRHATHPPPAQPYTIGLCDEGVFGSQPTLCSGRAKPTLRLSTAPAEGPLSCFECRYGPHGLYRDRRQWIHVKFYYNILLVISKW